MRRALAALALGLAACSDFPVRPEPAPVADPAAPIARDGFSVLPPGADWLVTLPAETIVLFDRGNAEAASAMLMDLGTSFTDAAQFAKFTHERREQEISPHQYLVLRHSEAPEPGLGPLCVRFDIAARNFSARAADGQPLVVVSQGVTCMHPQSPGFAVEVGYTRQSESTEMADALRAAGERVVRSLSFTPVTRPSKKSESHGRSY